MTEAQRLIDILENRRMDDAQEAKHDLEAAAELRRLDAVNARLLAALVEASVALRTAHNSLVAIEKARAAIKAATGEKL